MRKLLLIGRSGCGKTSLTQALKGESVHYKKTQGMVFDDFLIDSPGEYAENHDLGCALCLYSYEADIVALLIAADDDYSLFPPNITCMVNREVIGIVTKIDKADPKRAQRWLNLSGCKNVFFVNSKSGEGVSCVLDYLKNNKKPTKNGKNKEK
ncbi:MAG: EutP/PduV family microcompartment system protein [Clostridia bacterium]|nr:EutP/PduV family microcompartment system protein [Clostridia bacterium]MBQ2237433.1 EutP/PduV family microcompartment system protein [Clostridia bacterium]MEE1184794.1 EutP/PduV family microcompartment system protein [Acutalibacteraceae bacterium]